MAIRNPTFSKAGAATVTFDRGEDLGMQENYSAQQELVRSFGGAVKVNEFDTTDLRFISIRFTRISKTIYDNLVTFFQDSNVRWMKNTFTYTDTLAQTFTVRLITPTISAIFGNNQRTTLDIDLEITA
jgi:hypothetical protein